MSWGWMVAHPTVHSQAGYLQKMQDQQAVVVQPTQILVLKDLDTEAGQSSSEKSQHHPFTLGKPGCGIKEEAPKQDKTGQPMVLYGHFLHKIYSFKITPEELSFGNFSGCQRTR